MEHTIEPFKVHHWRWGRERDENGDLSHFSEYTWDERGSFIHHVRYDVDSPVYERESFLLRNIVSLEIAKSVVRTHCHYRESMNMLLFGDVSSKTHEYSVEVIKSHFWKNVSTPNLSYTKWDFRWDENKNDAYIENPDYSNYVDIYPFDRPTNVTEKDIEFVYNSIHDWLKYLFAKTK